MIPQCACIQFLRLGDQWACRLVEKKDNKVVAILAEGFGRRKEIAKKNMQKFV